jgi:hypothetical protein
VFDETGATLWLSSSQGSSEWVFFGTVLRRSRIRSRSLNKGGLNPLDSALATTGLLTRMESGLGAYLQ